jgi:ATP-dependent Clp protease ATP-binding subunit ClpC
LAPTVAASIAVVSYGSFVLENFSVGAQRVVSLAITEARRLRHLRVGTEHLLLGVLSDADGESAEVLRAAGVSLAAARHKVAEALGADAGQSKGEALPFTPRARRALERAGRFSRKDQRSEVTVAHVLLGVLDVEGLACQVLRGLDVDIDHLRESVVTTPVHVPIPSDDHKPAVAEVRPRCANCDALLDDTLRETVVSARRDGSTPTNVRVAYCAACGAALGVVGRESS